MPIPQFYLDRCAEIKEAFSRDEVDLIVEQDVHTKEPVYVLATVIRNPPQGKYPIYFPVARLLGPNPFHEVVPLPPEKDEKEN